MLLPPPLNFMASSEPPRHPKRLRMGFYQPYVLCFPQFSTDHKTHHSKAKRFVLDKSTGQPPLRRDKKSQIGARLLTLIIAKCLSSDILFGCSLFSMWVGMLLQCRGQRQGEG